MFTDGGQPTPKSYPRDTPRVPQGRPRDDPMVLQGGPGVSTKHYQILCSLTGASQHQKAAQGTPQECPKGARGMTQGCSKIAPAWTQTVVKFCVHLRRPAKKKHSSRDTTRVPQGRPRHNPKMLQGRPGVSTEINKILCALTGASQHQKAAEGALQECPKGARGMTQGCPKGAPE